jgi:hypothetical protein
MQEAIARRPTVMRGVKLNFFAKMRGRLAPSGGLS